MTLVIQGGIREEGGNPIVPGRNGLEVFCTVGKIDARRSMQMMGHVNGLKEKKKRRKKKRGYLEVLLILHLLIKKKVAEGGNQGSF